MRIRNVSVVVAVLLLSAIRISADPESTAGQPVYEIAHFEIKYAIDRSGQPDPAIFDGLSIELGEQADGVYDAPGRGSPVDFRLGDRFETSHAFTWGALEAICVKMVAVLNDHGLIGVIVGPEASEIAVAVDSQGKPVGGKDLRKPGDQVMRLVIRTSTVGQVRVIRTGTGVSGSRVSTSPKDIIIRGSPYQTPAEATSQATGGGNLLLKQPLDDYVALLNRYPNRHVDVAIAPGDDPAAGEVSLDYLINQPKPWEVYFQVANVGTRQTNAWRERIGFLDTELTNNDDVLSIDASTSSFEGSDAQSINYEAPLLGLQRLRYRVFAQRDEFEASDLGIANEDFSGRQLTGGADLILNIWQHGDWFLDATAGARFENINVNNRTVEISGTGDLLIPHGGFELTEVTPTRNIDATLFIAGNWPAAAGTDQTGIDQLGRTDVDRNFLELTSSVSTSIYLESLFWGGRTIAEMSDSTHPVAPQTLANEIAVTAHGQYAFNYRLVPQEQMVAGGFYSVRGYPEADTVGDTGVTGSVEYRWHIPRSFSPQANPGKLFNQPFRYAPQIPFGTTDWDLIFRTFVDAGFTMDNRPIPGLETNETLLSTGVGLELDVSRYLAIRTDWGVALHPTQDTTVGSNRFHIQVTVTY